MPVAFPSRDYDPDEVIQLLRQFEESLVEKTFPTIQAYLNAVDEFVSKFVVPDVEAFFRNCAQNIQLTYEAASSSSSSSSSSSTVAAASSSTSATTANSSSSSSAGHLSGIHEGLRSVIDHLSRVSGKIQDNFLPFLQEESCFLVHGDSQLLALVLEDVLANSKNVHIMILEGLPTNSGLRLFDRVQNSQLVRQNRELLKRLLLAPDSSALRLLHRPSCSFVLFGAHAVTPHGCLVNSAGSLQLATLAQECNVSVYSLCPTYKFTMSLKSMPFSSDDLVPLGATLPATNNNQNNNNNNNNNSSRRTSSPNHVAATLASSSVLSGGNSMNQHRSDTPDVFLPAAVTTSHNQQGGGGGSNSNSTSSAPTPGGHNTSPASHPSQPVSNTSFSGRPPAIQISPQLKPAPAVHQQQQQPTPPQQSPPLTSTCSSSSSSSKGDSQNQQQQQQLLLLSGSQSMMGDRSGSNPNNNNNNNTVSSLLDQNTFGAMNVTQNHNNNNQFQAQQHHQQHQQQPSASTPFGSFDGGGVVLTPQLRPAPSSVASSSTSGVLAVNSTTNKPGLLDSPIVAKNNNNGTVSSSVNNNSTTTTTGAGAGGAISPPLFSSSVFHYSPTCASALDLVNSNYITHFFTEHGCVMPWSVADKISKFFLKEIQNKRSSRVKSSANPNLG